MIKTIQIGNKAYDLKSSAYTMFSYKNLTGRDLLKDIGRIHALQKKAQESEEVWLDSLGDVLDIIEHLTYTMYLEANGKTVSFEEFLKGMDGILEDITWITEVMELAMSTFRRSIPNQ